MKAILIDPAAGTITEVEYGGDFREIYTLVDADTFDVARINAKGDVVYVDDEGLINGKPQDFFLIQGYPNPLAGKGLLLGSDAEGESKSPSVTLGWVKENTAFVFPVSVDGEILWLPKGA